MLLSRLSFTNRVILVLICALTRFAFAADDRKTDGSESSAILWIDPGDIKSRDLYYGPGGQSELPKIPVKFLQEDLHGNSPKFDVRDASGEKWKAKVGVEAKPETVASRLLWAVGYFANVNYFFPELKVDDLPPQLKRGQEFVEADGMVKGVRLQKHLGKKERYWNWHKNSFTGTREFNGLRVMMALLNNWDLKDDNNAVIVNPENPKQQIYEVSDVGASFGSSGESYTNKKSKGNLEAYSHSRFLEKVTDKHVDFNFPTHLPFLYIFNFPHFFSEQHNRSIGKHIPRRDARWVGSLLAQLTPKQIRDAFRAGGYSPREIETYARLVEERIAELNKL